VYLYSQAHDRLQKLTGKREADADEKSRVERTTIDGRATYPLFQLNQTCAVILTRPEK